MLRFSNFSSSGTSVFAYDGDNLIEETSSTGSVVARYLHGLNIDEPLAMLRSGATSYYEADGLGSVTSLSNSSGSVTNTYSYNSFGSLLSSTGSVVNPFQFTGRESDESGLYFYRARYYDPSLGRFLSEDPITFDGGIDFYRYSANNPVTFKDPFGLNTGPAIPWPWPLLPGIGAGGRAVGRAVGRAAGVIGRAGGAAITVVLELTVFAPAFENEEAKWLPKKPAPCDDAKRKACAAQYAKDLVYCEENFEDDPKMVQACYEIADLNLERCLNGQTRVYPSPIPIPPWKR